MLSNFLSSKFNLTLLQCILYAILGYLLKENYTWIQFGIVFVILLGIQFITHIKAVSTGMMLNQLMHEEKHIVSKLIKNIRKDKNDKDELPN